MHIMNMGFDANQLARLAASQSSGMKLRQGLVVGIYPATNPDDDYDVSLVEVEVGAGTMKVPYLDSYYPEIEDYVLLLSFEDQVFAVGSIAWGASISSASGGEPGPVGPTGPAGASETYVHTQVVASDTWTIEHNLGYFPAVTLVDSAGTVFVGSLQYPDVDTVIATFNGATSGKAYCS